MGWWGPLFPSAWWGGSAGHRLFPEGVTDTDTIPGNGPQGAATFAYALEDVEVTYGWQTDVFKTFGGKEYRRSLLDAPRQSYKGNALLAGTTVRTHRASLARNAALGQAFLIGMPWEALILSADSSSTTVYVGAGLLELSDWGQMVGQRVIVISNANPPTSIGGVIQSASTVDHSITLDVTPGVIGIAGGRIMPTMAVYLGAQQAFGRHSPAEPIERWQLDARAALFGFEHAAVKASLSLEGVAHSGVLDNVILTARVPGLAGDDIAITQTDDALSGVEINEDVDAKTIHIKYEGDTTTVVELAEAINLGSELIRFGGTYTGTDIVASADDEFAAFLDGGADVVPGTFGTGAAVTTYASKPVFDRGVSVDGTASDAVQAMSEIVDLGGVPFAVGEANVPDWGRQVSIKRQQRVAWQWLKAFLDVVRGRFKSFWLPTDRKDMVYVSSSTATGLDQNGNPATLTRLLVSDGDVFAWYPLRKHLKIVQADGTITYAQITLALANSDGTSSLQLDHLLSASAVSVISWLELCRLEEDNVSVTFKGPVFSMQTLARVVVQ